MQITVAQIKDLPPPGGVTTTRVVTTPYNILATDEVVFVNPDSLGSDITINLPPGVDGKHYRIIHSGTGDKVIVNPDGIDNLFGSNSSFTMNDAESIDLHYETIENWF